MLRDSWLNIFGSHGSVQYHQVGGVLVFCMLVLLGKTPDLPRLPAAASPSQLKLSVSQ